MTDGIVASGLVLASRSPRRRELLTCAGIVFQVVPADIEEVPKTGEGPGDYVTRLSAEKARVVAFDYPDDWIIGADTVVVIGDTVLEKPASAADARRMLTRLSHAIHRVFTGYTIRHHNRGQILSRTITTRVAFKALTPAEIDWYIGTNEPFGKAGGYAIQGLGSRLVTLISGSYTNVVGLPVSDVVTDLLSLGAIQLETETYGSEMEKLIPKDISSP